MRIIRCIRISEDIWNATRKSVKDDKTYVSHVIEALLRTYLLDRTITIAAGKGRNAERDATTKSATQS